MKLGVEFLPAWKVCVLLISLTLFSNLNSSRDYSILITVGMTNVVHNPNLANL